ncbi:hypothetical protein [Streptomyces sp. NPDC056387]|uniref:hypothetical protein n=1 Tax=Streptomyces sp. NPDC056387 TaxID=3345803 RepID=UPI0035E0EEB9
MPHADTPAPVRRRPRVRRRWRAPRIPARSITRAHMDALHDFLLRRTAYLVEAHPPGTEERRMADTLHRAIDQTWAELQDCYDFYHRGDADMEIELAGAWNSLRMFSISWMRAPDYDERLWPPAAYENLLITSIPTEH